MRAHGWVAAFLAFAAAVPARAGVVSISAGVDRAEIRPGESFELRVAARIQPPWHIYSLALAGDVGYPTALSLEAGNPFRAQGPWREPAPHLFGEGEDALTGHEGEVVFTLPLQVPKTLAPGVHRLSGTIDFMACDPESCLPPESLSFSVDVEVAAGPPRPAFVRGDATSPPALPARAPRPPRDAVGEAIAGGLGSFLLLSVVSGLAALLMPCVYPMIPITVSFFTKEAERRGRPPVALAALYAAGIVGTFTAIGLVFSAVLNVNVVDFVANPWVNLAIAALFFVFALSLFGLFEIRLPTFIVNAAGGADRSGALGVLVMGFAFSVASFTCTVQFVGSLLVLASGGERFWPALGLLVFSATLATPFFFLSLFPAYVSAVPRAGGWMHATKIVFGWVEIMAVAAYLAKAENVMGWGILSRPVVLAVWVFCTGIVVLYLSGWCFFRGEEPGPVGWGRRAFAAAFAALTLFIGRGFADRSLPLLDAFLPPLEYGRAGAGEEGVWLSDLDEARAAAAASGKYLLLDFTGIT